ncbi:hypothetical protein FisN_20Lh111 [Fistulifera solaris]|uniref:NADPH-dependent FMN reductase-like domain-containing protein n=1 Tax=Fistulifera solaris TaxID=1519565 RepID=A0A1Z5JCV8_FISSO|nr:hypothetical protein FisN_20Lh111 [Fistulifera solaris]|eukprot:GAX11834.1 hypothetical protein FisN_20Lh111 [Fistulifera solaris]
MVIYTFARPSFSKKRRCVLSLCLSSIVTCSKALLHVAVVTGTSHTDGPPRPVLGPRVCKFLVQHLEQQKDLVVSVLDSRQLPLMDKPAFAYSKSQSPLHLQQIQETLQRADAYVMITPEYNHAPSPALINFVNHFGSSVFSYKPSAIVTYSAGQWGGTRAAIALRPILSELGCLPVSAMIHIPHAADVLLEDGSLQAGQNGEQWDTYLQRCTSQLIWWGQAAQNHRNNVDPFVSSPVFRSNPSQRNAP